MRYSPLAMLVGAVMMSGNVGAQNAMDVDWRADVDEFGERLVTMGAVPGMGVAIVVGDWIVYSRGFGIADGNSGRPVEEDTLFYIASSTKSLTATAAVLAANRGYLNLQSLMTQHIAGLQDSQWASRQVRLDDLLALRHDMQTGGPVVFRTAYSGDFNQLQLVELLKGYGPHPEGKAFRYDNLGYNLMGMVLGQVLTGSPDNWKDAVRDTVLSPLGMTETTATPADIPMHQLAMPHQGGVAEPIRIRLGKTDANLHAAGGHFSSARSLARFVAAHITHGVVEGERLLPPEPLALTQQSHANQTRRFANYERTGWGYGWDIATLDNEDILTRFGTFNGYFSHMSFMPEHRIGVVVLGNALTMGPDSMAGFIYRRLLRKVDAVDMEAALEKLAETTRHGHQRFAEERARRLARQTSLQHPLDAFVGTFVSAQLGTMEWRLVAGGLEVRMGVAHSRAEVFDAAQDALRVELTGGGGVARFSFDEAGRATAVHFGTDVFARVDG